MMSEYMKMMRERRREAYMRYQRSGCLGVDFPTLRVIC